MFCAQDAAKDTMQFAKKLSLFITCFPILIKSGMAQESKKFTGDYLAVSGPVHVKLHLIQTGDSVTGTLDSPELRVAGLPLSDIRISGQNLSFSAPTIKGAWTGFLSEDGNSLSGTWNQGNSIALNFTRIGTPESHAATLSPSSPNPQSDSTCPAGSMADYWDGSSWKPMTMAVEAGKKRDYSFTRGLKNPLNPMAGHSQVFIFEGTSASITLGQNPRFCFPVTVNSRGEYFIGILTIKNNDREVERFVSDRRNPGGNLMFPVNKSLATNVKPLSDRFVEVTSRSL